MAYKSASFRFRSWQSDHQSLITNQLFVNQLFVTTPHAILAPLFPEGSVF